MDPQFLPFTTTMTIDAIRRTKNSTAAGPNGLTSLHLKHLGPLGFRFLTRLFNLSVQTANIPSIWKSAVIIPVPKPGKPLDQGTSYRPISLLAPEGKVLERLIMPFLHRAINPNDSQHGFRSNRSIVTALLPLVTTIARGFNAPKPALRMGLLCFNLSKGF